MLPTLDTPEKNASEIDKQNWNLTTGPMTDGSLAALLDGKREGSIEDSGVFATPNVDTDEYYDYPFVQVDFTAQKVVKGVHLYRY